MPTFYGDWYEHEAEKFGKYIIEVCLNERRPGDPRTDYHGFIRFWLRLGSRPCVDDEMLYVHANPACHALLRGRETRNILCPQCGRPLQGEVGESRIFKMTLDKLADQIAEFHRNLEGDADIRLIRYKLPHREQQIALAEDAQMRDRLHAMNRIWQDKEDAIYTKGRIERDTAASGDIRKRILAFLQS